MTTATIKVPVELRDRLAERARHEHSTMAGAIAHALDAADDAAFWAEVRATMGSLESQSALAQDVEKLAPSLTDGLDPDEDWSDIL